MTSTRADWLRPRAPPVRALKIALLAACYVAAARFGLMMDALGGLATLVWPPTGIALASLLMFGLELWPGVALGALIANRWVGAPALVCVLIALGNTLEALAGAYLLRRLGDFERGLGRLKNAALLVLAAVVSTPLSATLGVSAMALSQRLPASGFWLTWQVWWVGDLIGDLVVAPLLLAWWLRDELRLAERLLEALVLGTGLLLVLGFVFDNFLPTLPGWPRQPHLLIPLLIWATIRFGPRGASAATLLASAGAIWGTALGHGPFARATLHEGLLALQSFMSIVAVTFLLLGAVTAERRELLDRERAARAVAERAVRVRDDFLAVASHELRTPLAPLQLQLEGIRRAADSGDPRLAERVGRALAQGARLARLIDGLLDVSRLTSGALELAREECDMEDIVRSALDQAREQAERAGSTLRLLGAGPALGQWDRGRSEQLLSNLLSNAIKYGRGAPIEIRLELDPDWVKLEVADGGIGIAPEALQRIFERFERAAPSGEYDGLGLGLYVARQIALAHQGEISVKSEPNVGSTFAVRLPRAAN